jgi:hypothetical protein
MGREAADLYLARRTGSSDTKGKQKCTTIPRHGRGPRRAAVDGSGALWANGSQQAEPVTLVIDGSGDLSFSGAVPRADVVVSGSGDARLQGTAAALAATVDGSGAVDARGLDATTADLSISGSGDLAASVSGAARVSVSGSGSVNLYGGAVLERVDISGSGSVRQH